MSEKFSTKRFSWQKLERPFTVLAPMEDVTDTCLRQMVCALGRPDVFFTEFVNCDGLNSIGQEIVKKRLKYNSIEKPLIAQLWGSRPETFFQSAKQVVALGFDGIDINMGCPQKDVMQHGAGASLIGQYDLVAKIIAAVKNGTSDLPLSVKIRLGIKNTEIEDWIEFLFKQKIDALTVHGRTVKEGFSGEVHWDKIGEIVEMRNKLKVDTVIVGNGSIVDLEQGKELCMKYKMDGFMIGRQILRNPWVFNPLVDPTTIEIAKRIELALRHLDLFHETWQDEKNISNFKKYLKMYLNDFPGAQELRVKLMAESSYAAMRQLLLEVRPLEREKDE